jgi:hypothetical protein
MTQQQRASQEQVDAAYFQAGEQLALCASARPDVERLLIEQNWSPQTAAAIVADVCEILGQETANHLTASAEEPTTDAPLAMQLADAEDSAAGAEAACITVLPPHRLWCVNIQHQLAAPCPYCGAPLLAASPQQCFVCGINNLDSGNAWRISEMAGALLMIVAVFLPWFHWHNQYLSSLRIVEMLVVDQQFAKALIFSMFGLIAMMAFFRAVNEPANGLSGTEPRRGYSPAGVGFLWIFFCFGCADLHSPSIGVWLYGAGSLLALSANLGARIWTPRNQMALQKQ